MRASEEKSEVKTPKVLRVRYSVKDILAKVPDLEQMDVAALQEYLGELEEALARLDIAEPRNENSDAYEEWAIEHEDLEDLMDEVLDLLDER